MQIETWEEACKYLWQNNDGSTMELSIEEGAVYFTLGGGTRKHYWLMAGDRNSLYILKRWKIIGNSPNSTNNPRKGM